MKINIEDIRKWQKFKHKINNAVLRKIQFYEKGKRIIINPGIIENFIDLGLSNIDFITSNIYKMRTIFKEIKTN